jgi:hypothetical protein
MTKPLPFTEASIRRAVTGARKAGLRVTAFEVRPDGTVVVRSVDDSQPGIAQPRLSSEAEIPSQEAPEWGDVEA